MASVFFIWDINNLKSRGSVFTLSYILAALSQFIKWNHAKLLLKYQNVSTSKFDKFSTHKKLFSKINQL